MKFRLQDISVKATNKAKFAISDRRPVDAVKIIRNDLGCNFKEAYDLYQKLRDDEFQIKNKEQ